jgi:hypothetical protein
MGSIGSKVAKNKKVKPITAKPDNKPKEKSKTQTNVKPNLTDKLKSKGVQAQNKIKPVKKQKDGF